MAKMQTTEVIATNTCNCYSRAPEGNEHRKQLAPTAEEWSWAKRALGRFHKEHNRGTESERLSSLTVEEGGEDKYSCVTWTESSN